MSDAPPNARLPLLPLRDFVLFPGGIYPVELIREQEVALAKDVNERTSGVIATFAQRDPKSEGSAEGDLHPVGCTAQILTVSKADSGNTVLVLKGVDRVRLIELTQTFPYLEAETAALPDSNAADPEMDALSQHLRAVAEEVVRLVPDLPTDVEAWLDAAQRPGDLADLMAANLGVSLEEKVLLLGTTDVKERVRRVLAPLSRELELLELRARVDSTVRERIRPFLEKSPPPAPDQIRREVLRLQRDGILEELALTAITAELLKDANVGERVEHEVGAMRSAQRRDVLRIQLEAVEREIAETDP